MSDLGKLVVRADGGPHIGGGHVMRCLALAQEWRSRGGIATFASTELSAGLAQRLSEAGFTFEVLDCVRGSESDAAITGSLAATWVAADGYAFGHAWQQAIRRGGKRLLVIDDYAHLPRYSADLLLNQNTGAEALQYDGIPTGDRLCGPTYALLRDEFVGRVQRSTGPGGPSILVTMGGSDPEDVTRQVLEGLVQLDCSWQGIVVLGSDYAHEKRLRNLIETRQLQVELHRDTRQMPALLQRADLAVSSAGSTCWELCCLGNAMVLVTLADNQHGIACGLAAMGAARHIGWFGDCASEAIAKSVAELLADPDAREALAANAAALVDGKGRQRVVDAMEQRMRSPWTH